MSSKEVDQALVTLLPTHENDMPPDLRSLAMSLIAQSRSHASNLKPEEEIARPYACAEIACKRLSKSLRLPPLLGHPPCPPRVYKKLYTYLDRTLADASNLQRRQTVTAGSRPARHAVSATGAGASTENGPATRAPSKSNLKRTLTAPSRRKPSGTSQNTNIKDAPNWVMPQIRLMCKTLSTPTRSSTTWSRPPVSASLAPHIFSGVSSILEFAAREDADNVSGETEADREFLAPILDRGEKSGEEDGFKQSVTVLIVAIYFLTLSRRRNISSGKAPSGSLAAAADAAAEGTGAEDGETATTTTTPSGKTAAAAAPASQKLDAKTYAEMCTAALQSLGLSGKKFRKDVDRWIATIMQRRWAKGQEWFQNVPLPGADEDGMDDMDEQRGERNGQAKLGMSRSGLPAGAQYGDDRADDGDRLVTSKRRRVRPSTGAKGAKETAREGLLPGLGTMMQDRVDWLSEDRREDYLEWKHDILGRIEHTERGIAVN